MDPRLNDMLKAARTTFTAEFESQMKASQYAELLGMETEPTGLLEFFATAQGGRFKQLKGNTSARSITERNFTLLADTFYDRVRVPRRKWKQLEAWLGSNLPRMGSNFATGARNLLETMITDIMERIARMESLPNFYHDSVFAGEFEMPGGGAGEPTVKIRNYAKLGAFNTKNVKAAFHLAEEMLADHRYGDGTEVFSPGEAASDMRIMFPVKQNITSVIHEAFDTGRTTSRDQKDKITGVAIRPNSHWNHRPTLNGQEKTVLLFYKPIVGKMPMFQGVQTREGLDELQQDILAPGASLDDVGEGNYVPSSQQDTQNFSLTALKALQVAPGSPLQFVLAEFGA